MQSFFKSIPRSYCGYDRILDTTYLPDHSSISDIDDGETFQKPRLPGSRLESLPAELLYMISERLNNVSRYCLTRTCSRLRTLSNTNTSTLSRCERWLLMCRLEVDKLPADNLTQFACCFCKSKLTQNKFEVSPIVQQFTGRIIDNHRLNVSPVE